MATDFIQYNLSNDQLFIFLLTNHHCH